MTASAGALVRPGTEIKKEGTDDDIELLALAAVAVRDLDGSQVLPEVSRPACDLQAASISRLKDLAISIAARAREKTLRTLMVVSENALVADPSRC